jgi:hypothetical protein
MSSCSPISTSSISSAVRRSLSLPLHSKNLEDTSSTTIGTIDTRDDTVSSPSQQEDVTEIPSMTSSSSHHQTPHRRHPHHHALTNNGAMANNTNGDGTSTMNTSSAATNTNSNSNTNSNTHNNATPSPRAGGESPGISKLWKHPSSPQSMMMSATSPRRVLYPSPTTTTTTTTRRRPTTTTTTSGISSFWWTSKQQQTRKAGGGGRGPRIITTYLMVAIGLACGTYLYLASSIILTTTNSSTSTSTTPISTNQQQAQLPPNHPLLRENKINNILANNQHRPPPFLQGSTSSKAAAAAAAAAASGILATTTLQNQTSRTRWQRSRAAQPQDQHPPQQLRQESPRYATTTTKTKTTTTTTREANNPVPRVVVLDTAVQFGEDDSTQHSPPTASTKATATTISAKIALKVPLGPIHDEEEDNDNDNDDPSLLSVSSTQAKNGTDSSLLPVVANGIIATNNTNTNTNTNINNATTSEDNGATNTGPEDKGGVLLVDNLKEKKNQEEAHDVVCEAAESWQTEAHPNCNSLHEIDMDPTNHDGAGLNFLGQGWFRSAWRLDPTTDDDTNIGTSVVVKMLRLEREFLDEYYELHRRDAVAMDHLTFSPYVINVYGYCGQSAINELAEFKEGINALEQLDRRLRGKDGDGVLLLKLRLALSISIGLYHVHYGRPGLPWEHAAEDNIAGATSTNLTAAIATPPRMRATMAHYDINPRNIAIVASGKPKLNDFNIGEFLRYPQSTTMTGAGSNSSSNSNGISTTNTTCGFPSRLHEPWWRAPEEMDTNLDTLNFVDEKVDVYALGAVLFHILTTHSPRGKMKKERMEGVRATVQQGIRPTLMEPWASRQEPVVKAFREAMDLCFHADPKQRGTTAQVATILYRGLQKAPALEATEAHDAVEAQEDKKKNKKTTTKTKKKTDRKHDGRHR